MKRRTLLARLGAASAVAVGSIGSTTARSGAPLDIDRRVHVSDVPDDATLADVFDERQLDALPDAVEPAAVEVEVQDAVEPTLWCCNSGCSTDCSICVPCDEIIDPITQ